MLKCVLFKNRSECKFTVWKWPSILVLLLSHSGLPYSVSWLKLFKTPRLSHLGKNQLTLNLKTSSIFAVLPSLTQLWKNDGATETPRASLVIPVRALSLFTATTRNVPNNRTSSRWVYTGRDVINLLIWWSHWNHCYIINKEFDNIDAWKKNWNDAIKKSFSKLR